MRKEFVVYFKNESGLGMEWETPGNKPWCTFASLKSAKDAVKELVNSDPITWGETEFNIEEE